MERGSRLAFAIIFLAGTALTGAAVRPDTSLEVARRAYEASDFTKAIQVLQEAAAKGPKDSDIQLLLAKSYLEPQEQDSAIQCAGRAVALVSQTTLYHESLGRAC